MSLRLSSGDLTTAVANTGSELTLSVGVLVVLLLAIGATLLALRRRSETWR